MSRFSWWAMALAAMLCLAACGTHREGTAAQARTVKVAQTGPADVVGNDDKALQTAMNLLQPGDTLAIGPGTYQMNNSVFVPSGVTVRGASSGTGGQTILHKSAGVESTLVEDADYGDTVFAVAEPRKFQPGMGVSFVDDKLNSGWDVTVSTVSAVKPPYILVDPMTLRDYAGEKQHGRVRNTFPILSVVDAENVTLEDVIVDGNRAQNAYIDGCRGGAIYMYRVRNVTVRRAVARNYNGDGISFQITDGVKVLDSESYGHAGYGMHPGTGSANAVVERCKLHDNGDIGLFLCWRVRHARFSNNVMEHNGHYGISIGHKDTDNEFIGNTIARNGTAGVLFRKEGPQNSGHRNTFRQNKVLDNGNAREGYGFYIEPSAADLLIEDNVIAETRGTGGTQRFGVYRTKGAAAPTLRGNAMSGHRKADVH
ncbi:MAG: right-handed parallel beta-helix repeat-containing protein [Bryobacteraceae bacterium]